MVATNFTFRTRLDDYKSPTMVSTVPRNQSILIEPSLGVVTLEFDEPVQAGDNSFAIRSWFISGTSPTLTNSVRTLVSPKGGIIVLSFDATVQAGSGHVELMSQKHGMMLREPVSALTFVGRHALMVVSQDSASLPADFSVRTTDAESIRSTDMRPANLNAAPVQERVFSFGEIPLELVYTSMEEYACMPPTHLPEIRLYLNKFVGRIDGTKSVELRSHNSSGQPDVLHWSLPAVDVMRMSTDLRQRHIVTIDMTALASGLLGSTAQPLPNGFIGELILESGLLKANSTNIESAPDLLDNSTVVDTLLNTSIDVVDVNPTWSIHIRTCNVIYDTPSGNLVFLSTDLSSSVGAKRFKVTVPETAVLDALGNRVVASYFEFSHEYDPPQLSVADVNPIAVSSLQENILLSFSEVVQAGVGAFEIWEVGRGFGPRYVIDVAKIAAVSQNGLSLFNGRKVSITPKTLCNGVPACGDLEPGKSYYLTTTKRGVVKDLVGNALPALNTSEPSVGWTFHTNPLGFEVERPRVAFVGRVCRMKANSIVGSIYFTERVVPVGRTLPIRVEICTAHGVCSSTAANGVSPGTPILQFGDGSSSDGTSDYGLVRFEADLPTAYSRYRVTVLSNSVRDMQTVYSRNYGPFNNYAFYFAFGPGVTCATPVNAAERGGWQLSGPSVLHDVGFNPRRGSLAVPTNVSIVLWFDEDVQRGTGTVRFCTNSDARADGKCEFALLSDRTAAYVDVAASIVEGAKVVIRPPKPFYPGQDINVVMPAGVLRSTNDLPDDIDAIDGSTYTFTLEELDIVAPQVLMFPSMITASGNLTILFSEAVQGASTIELSLRGASVEHRSVFYDGSAVAVAGPWTPGATYRVTLRGEQIKDLASNPLMHFVGNMSVSEDVHPPNATIHPSVGRINREGAIVMNFSERVRKGAGNVILYSRLAKPCMDLCCDGGRAILDLDIMDVPLIVTTVGDSLRSFLILDLLAHAATKSMSDPLPFETIDAESGDHNGSLVTEPVVFYSLWISASAILDVAGNGYAGLVPFPQYTVRVSGVPGANDVPPSLVAVRIGGRGAPNPDFAQGAIELYFTEAVQMAASSATNKFVRLVPNTGGYRCSAASQECNSSTNCTSPCAYPPGSADMSFADNEIQVQGVQVRIWLDDASRRLGAGKGFKLIVDQGKILDHTGREVDQLDGETSSVAIVFRTSLASAEEHSSRGPYHVTSFPVDGSTMLPPSTGIRISFSEVVQAGEGFINFGTDARDRTPVTSCYFNEHMMSCRPPRDLIQNTRYSVSYTKAAVRDEKGNVLSRTIDDVTDTLTFKVIDQDYSPPLLVGSEYPSVGVSNNPSGSAIVLLFSEVVQAGNGAFELISSEPQSCSGSMRQARSEDQDNVFLSINMTADKSSANVMFDGKRVYLQVGSFHYGKSYAIRTTNVGVVLDAVGFPLGLIDDGFEFGILHKDSSRPEVLEYHPSLDAQPTGVTADVFLYFSEAVQASRGTSNRIVFSDGAAVRTLFANNSAPMHGIVEVTGNIVRIALREAVAAGSLVSVLVPEGAFTDFAGNPSREYLIEYKTIAANFSLLLSSISGVTHALQGPILHTTDSEVFLYGGNCSSSLWVSQNGSDWKLAVESSSNSSKPRVAHAPKAVDQHGCVYLLGQGRCDKPAKSSGRIWRSCDNMYKWTELDVPLHIPSPWPKQGSIPSFPSFWLGHAIVIVGGWRLVIVDAASIDGYSGSGIWAFLDPSLRNVRRVAASPLVFGARQDPRLVATSQGWLYLIGGVRGGSVLNDVWLSKDDGKSWACQTADYAQGTLQMQSHLGVNAVATITGDDSVFVFAEAQTDNGARSMYRSLHGPVDLAFASLPYMWYPAETTNIQPNTSYVVYFQENIQMGTGMVNMRDVSASHDIPIDLSVDRQFLTIKPLVRLKAGHLHRVEVEGEAVTDIAGNAASRFLRDFVVSSDVDSPIVEAMHPSGLDVSPHATIMLAMSEPVVHGEGALHLVPSVGAKMFLDIANASVVGGRYVIFEMRSAARLIEGQLYDVFVPAGLLRDRADNENEAMVAGRFRVVSGFVASENYLWDKDASKDSTIALHTFDALSSAEFVAARPRQGASDVPVGQDIRLELYFSKPVVANATGVLHFFDGARLIESLVTDGSSWLEFGHGLAIKVPGRIFTPGLQLTISVPAGVVQSSQGESVRNFQVSFACLAGKNDTSAPVILSWNPSLTHVPMDTPFIELYFSEHVRWINNTITIIRPSGSRVIVRPTSFVTESRKQSYVVATLSRSRFVITLTPGILDEVGTYVLDIPKGAFVDVAGNFHEGLDATSGKFYVKQEDSISPRLRDFKPSSEMPPFLHELSSSTPVLLTFDEPVQAGSASIVFEGLYSKEKVIVPARDTFLSGERAFISPHHGLLPGEVYTVTVEAGSYFDLAGNKFEGFEKYTLSIARLLSFDRVSSTQFDAQHKYEVRVSVDRSNAIYVFSGRSLWKMSTGHATACASYDSDEALRCSESQCAAPRSPKETPSLGFATIKQTVWRPPSAYGAGCKRDDGSIARRHGEQLSSRTEPCSCPACVDPPGPDLPDHMVNAEYLREYALTSAFQGSRPLRCQSGYVPEDSFICELVSAWSARFRVPSPACLPRPCEERPPTPRHAATIAFSDDSCVPNGSNWSIPHGASCAFTCAAGYLPSGSLTCSLGNWSSETCDKQVCSLPTNERMVLECDTTSGTIESGQSCPVKCIAGYRQTNPIINKVVCPAIAGANVPPELTQLPNCEPSSCEDFAYTDFAKTEYTGKQLGSKLHLTCEDNYTQTRMHTLTCGPTSSVAGVQDVAWQDESGRQVGPLCLPAGKEIRAMTSVRHRMTAVFKISAVALCDPALGVYYKLRTAIANALTQLVPEMAPRNGIFIVDDIAELVVSSCVSSGSRRLTAEAPMPLGYVAHARDEDSANSFISRFDKPGDRETIAAAFILKIRAEELNISSLDMSTPILETRNWIVDKPSLPPFEPPKMNAPTFNLFEELANEGVSLLIISLSCFVLTCLCLFFAVRRIYRRRMAAGGGSASLSREERAAV
eukprot:TRINITY_DN14871_c0_g2_i1.p1 TRINITY_DN14871_c0_g2~~TRINITY_DN14871_c0_g2_i1.p1  ORF type:complete len:3371 (-),score=230.50 TRINITY_DN14871_c0_g2_i1:116-9247(-)